MCVVFVIKQSGQNARFVVRISQTGMEINEVKDYDKLL